MSPLKTIGIVGSVAVFLLSATVVLAHSQTTTDNQGASAVRTEPIEVRKGAMATTTRAETEDTARERMKIQREEAKTRMETKREEAKQRLADIRDNKKQQMAERFIERFDKLNQKWTDHFGQLLDRYGAILLKIRERADIAATNGKDIAATNAAIQSAKTAIESARTSVIAQAAKTYTLDTSSITTTAATTTSSGQNELMKGLRTAFQNIHRILFKDLFALRDGAMKNARVAVQTALQTLNQIPKVDDDAFTDNSNQ